MASVSSNNSAESEVNIDNVSSLVLDITLEKDKTSFAPIDIEVQILNERIKSILEEIISKTEIVIFLNSTREFDIRPLLEEVIPKEHLEIICDETFYIVNEDYVDNPYKIITREMIEETQEHPEATTFPELTDVFNIFAKYPQVKPVIKMKAQEKMLNPPGTVNFLRAMYRLRTKIEERIATSALEKLRKDIMQRNLKKTNQTLKDKIEAINTKLDEENNVFSGIFQQKDAVKKTHQAELELLKSECITIIKKKIVASERQMMKDTTQHKIDFENLVEQEIKIKQDYEDLLRMHIGEEEQLRGKRFKIETTLTSWLQKYDKEIGDRQNELDNLTQNYDDEKIALADLKVRFDEQEKIYTPLITMKRTEEETNFAMRYNGFRTNYAARKIQRWWRGYLKKTKKKGKKKKR